MSTGDDGHQHHEAPSEDRLVLYLRLSVGIVITLCVAFLVVVGSISGRIDATVIGILVGAAVTLAGIELPRRLGGK